MKVLLCVLLAALPVSSPNSQQAPEATASAFISRLYAEYVWETKDADLGRRLPLFAAPVVELRQYLDPALTRAVLADRACEDHVQGECNLSFEPIWDSQDPGGATVQVVSTRDSSVVQARIHYPYQNETRLVTYRLRRTPAGWRIVDMSGAKWPSLLKLLRRPVPQ